MVDVQPALNEVSVWRDSGTNEAVKKVEKEPEGISVFLQRAERKRMKKTSKVQDV